MTTLPFEYPSRGELLDRNKPKVRSALIEERDRELEDHLALQRRTLLRLGLRVTTLESP